MVPSRYRGILLVLGLFACQSGQEEFVGYVPPQSGEISKQGLKSFKDIGVIKPVANPVKGTLRSQREEPSNLPLISEIPENYTGSLTTPTNQGVNLFLDNVPLDVGSKVVLMVKEVRSSQNTNANSREEADATELTDQLLSSLPVLEPEDGTNKKVVTKINATVVERLSNGDLLLEAKRTSMSNSQLNFVFFRGKIPSDRIFEGNKASILDLESVVFQEQSGGEFIERRSAGWEDQYTLRYSGFKEVPSKLARKMESDRKSLIGMRDRFENRLKSFKSEREKMAKEREKLYEQNSDMRSAMEENEKKVQAVENRLKEVEEKVKDRDRRIEDLQKELDASRSSNEQETSSANGGDEGEGGEGNSEP